MGIKVEDRSLHINLPGQDVERLARRYAPRSLRWDPDRSPVPNVHRLPHQSHILVGKAAMVALIIVAPFNTFSERCSRGLPLSDVRALSGTYQSSPPALAKLAEKL